MMLLSKNALVNIYNVCLGVVMSWSGKYMFQYLQFYYSITTTAFVLGILSLFSLFFILIPRFQAKPIPLEFILPSSILLGLFIWLTTISLERNTFVLYTIFQTSSLPFSMLLRRFFHKTSNSKSIIAICIICIGISLSILDNIIHSAYIGTISGLLSGISFSIYEIYLEKKLPVGLNGKQIMFYQAPIACILSIILWPWTENIDRVMQYPDSLQLTFMMTFFFFCVVYSLYQFTILELILNPSESKSKYDFIKYFSLIIFGLFVFDRYENPYAIISVIFVLIGLLWKAKEDQSLDDELL